MRTYPAGKSKAITDYLKEKAQEGGMRFDTVPTLSEPPWKRELRKLSDVLLDEPPAFAPEP